MVDTAKKVRPQRSARFAGVINSLFGVICLLQPCTYSSASYGSCNGCLMTNYTLELALISTPCTWNKLLNKSAVPNLPPPPIFFQLSYF